MMDVIISNCERIIKIFICGLEVYYNVRWGCRK